LTEYPPLTPSPDYQSICTYTIDYGTALTGLVEQSKDEREIIMSGSYIASGTAGDISEAHPHAYGVLSKEIDKLRQNRDDQKRVYEGLRKHNPVMADMFLSAWQSFELPVIDPARGPAFLMRETLTHFLHHLAPDNLVMAKKWWEKPHDERTKITRGQRIRFIWEEQIIETKKTPLIEHQLKELKKLCSDRGGLNRAHTQRPLDIDYVKPRLYQAQDLLKSLLQVIRPPAMDKRRD
jgi:hypothetical protein